MTETPTGESRTAWLMLTLHHAVTAALRARLASTLAVTQTHIPNVRAMMDKQKLPCCGYEVEMASAIDGPETVPKPDDVTICLNCGSWHRFDANLKCELFEAEDLLDLTDEQLSKMRRVTEEIRKRGPFER